MAICLLPWSSAYGQQNDTLRFEPLLKGLQNAQSLYAAPGGKLFLVETGQNRLFIVDDSGARLDSLGNQGFGNYQFDRPLDVDATNGLKIYVSDTGNRRIQVFDRRMQYLSTIEQPPESYGSTLYKPDQLTTTSTGELLFMDTNNGSLVKYDYQGTFDWSQELDLYDMAIPADLVFFNSHFAASDSKNGVIHLLTDTGRYIRFIGGVPGAGAMAVHDNQLWVVARGHQLQRFDKNGRRNATFTYKIDSTINVQDLALSGRWLFLLTTDSLYRLSLDGIK